jgi:putative SOS response-associated peptidase YedK
VTGQLTNCYTIVITDANGDLEQLHNRMPVILEPDDWSGWLGEVEVDPGMMFHPSPDSTVRTWPVNKRVGSPSNNGAAFWSR